MDRHLNWLELVYKQHKTWIAIVKTFGETNYAEDIVQESYIALAKYAEPSKIFEKNEKGEYRIRRGYMYFTLRSLYLQYYNKKSKVNKIPLEELFSYYQLTDNTKQSIDEQQAYNKVCKLIDQLSDTWTWYDKKIWKLYSQSDMSIRDIAAERRISWVSIFNTLKKIKTEIKNKIQEDYDDYKNEDYERI
jgi:predicted DNA-binding protein YlxM (UPF0122 family)